MKGLSLRTLAKRFNQSLGKTYNQLVQELKEIPHNNFVTMKYCNSNRFGGVLLVDGKYVKVKGYEKKIPFIFGIDYETHDIPICTLAPTENYIAMADFFMKIRNTSYKLRGVVCDDNEATKMGAKSAFQKIYIQLCHTHFLENIRRSLRTRTEEKYRPFVDDIKKAAFSEKLRKKKIIKRDLFQLIEKYPNDAMVIGTLRQIEENIDELTNHLKIGACPKTNNLIESYNKQLNGRLKTIQGFECFDTAERWLSAWILRRRLTPFTDCRGKFKNLNGKFSLQKTIRGGLSLPDFF